MSYVPCAFNRLSDNDRHFGPLTIGERSNFHKSYGLDLRSGNDEHPGTSLNLHFAGWWVRFAIPAVVKPWRQWVDTSRLFPDRPDGSGYWDVHRREYGFSFSDSSLFLCWGPQTHDSTTTKSRCIFLPWKQLRHVRHSYYGLSGEHFWTEPSGRQVPRHEKWQEMERMREQCPRAVFDVEDCDGTKVRATTYIEEREWRHGEGWFRWLSVFRRPVISRSLKVDFDKEVGYEKGSWKGGFMGGSIDLEPGELHAEAMGRFCAKGIRNKNGVSTLKLLAAIPHDPTRTP